MKFNIITLGGATVDITLHTDEGILIDNREDILRQKLLAFEYGAKVKINKSSSSFGGGAANAAVASSLLGLKSAAIVAIGDDERGKSILENFKKKKVFSGYVKKYDSDMSGLSFLLVGQNNEHIVFSARGSNSALKLEAKDLKNLKNTEWIYLTSLSGKWEEVLNKVFTLKGVKFAWNPGHIQLSAGYKKLGKHIKKTKVLIVNKDEAIELAISSPEYKGKEPEYFNEIQNLLRIIKKMGSEIVVVTNGQYGAHAYDGKEYYYQPVIKEKKRVDTTGVGDVFGSTFISGMIMYKGDIKKSLLLSARNTASAIGHMGAQNGLITKKDI